MNNKPRWEPLPSMTYLEARLDKALAYMLMVTEMGPRENESARESTQVPKIANIITVNGRPFLELEWPPDDNNQSVSVYTEKEVESIRRHVREDENWKCAQVAEMFGDPQIRDGIRARNKR